MAVVNRITRIPTLPTMEESLKMADLLQTHDLYDKYEDEWRFLRAAYNGARALTAWGAIFRHERESADNYIRRISESYGFSYSRSIVDLFNFYLFKEPVHRTLGKLAEDELWQMFQEDSDLLGTDFDMFLLEQSKNASIEGHVGILVDKANLNKFEKTDAPANRADEIENEIYPYVACYRPQNIIDWTWERDMFNRPTLTYLKLYEFDGTDGYWRIWTPLWWQVWKEPEEIEGGVQVRTIDQTGRTTKGGVMKRRLDPQTQAELIDQGDNPLGEIPFVWLYNDKSDDPWIGMSDIVDIARIDASILRNLSQSEEIVNYAAFPMMVKPKAERGEAPNDEVGVTAVLEFDPEHPESKPEWLTSEVGGPIDAIFKIISKKIEEIYRSSNVGGMASTEISTQAKSGTALRAEFQLLNSKLVGKGRRVQEAEVDIMRYWTMWQLMEEVMDDVVIERSKSYDVENLTSDLENILTAQTLVNSETFQKRTMKQVVRLMLPAEDDEEIKVIDDEIDALTTEPPVEEEPVVQIPPEDEEEAERLRKEEEAKKKKKVVPLKGNK